MLKRVWESSSVHIGLMSKLHPHNVSRVADSSYPRILREQVGEDPAHLENREKKTD